MANFCSDARYVGLTYFEQNFTKYGVKNIWLGFQTQRPETIMRVGFEPKINDNILLKAIGLGLKF